MFYFKKFYLILIISGGAAVFLLAGFSGAYDTNPTHPILAEKSARIFNQYYDGELSGEDIREIVQGAINEDTPPRWINHFFDPTTGRGWNAERMGNLPPEILRQISLFGLSSAGAVSAPNWARDQDLQNRYSAYEGNRTFQKAVYDYVNGDKKSAYRALGHILHLIEDMTVPAHTRQDTHYEMAGDPGEPYEKWAKENTDLSHLNNLDLAKENFSCQNLDDCFNKLSRYSNENFFSEDTIRDSAYNLPLIGRKEKKGIYDIYYSENNNYPLAVFRHDNGIFTVSENFIHSAYWQKLSIKAVLGGVEVIRIFQEEVLRAEKDRGLLEEPPSIATFFSQRGLATGLAVVFAPSAPSPIVSTFGALTGAYNWAKSVLSFVTSQTSSLSVSLLGLFGGESQPIVQSDNVEINQGAIEQYVANQGNNSPQPSLSQREGGDENDSPIINITPQNFPQQTSAPISSAPQISTASIPLESGQDQGNGEGITFHDYTSDFPKEVEEENSLNDSLPISDSPQASSGSGGTGGSSGGGGGGGGSGSGGENNQDDEILPSPPFEKEGEDNGSEKEGEDNNPPETYATSTLFFSGELVATTTAIFEFSSNKASTTFECILDDASSTLCVSPQIYENLRDGEHSFSVKAVDENGNEDDTPVIFSWTIDSTGPEISFGLNNYAMNSINFDVFWNSSSSDIISYEIQYRIGKILPNPPFKKEGDEGNSFEKEEGDGVWQDWQKTTDSGQKSFQATRDNTIYYFRGRAVDNLGNQSPWQEIQAKISQKSIVINEMMYNPYPGSDSYYEYLELYNASPWDIDLAGWQIVSGSNEHILSADEIHNGQSTIIKSGGYALVSDLAKSTTTQNVYDGYYPNIPEYSENAIRLAIDDAALNLTNIVNTLALKDAEGNIVEFLSYGRTWGANGNGKSLERINPFGLFPEYLSSWKPSEDGGTPNRPNSALDFDYGTVVTNDDITLNKDTIFSRTAGPFRLGISGHWIRVSAGATLIIEPGTIIESSNSYGAILKIEGTLKAVGLSEQEIVFTASQQLFDIERNAGTYLEFLPASADSEIDYAVFEKGGNQLDYPPRTLYPMVKIDQSLVKINHSVFREAFRLALYLDNSSSEIRDSRFMNNLNAVYIIGENSAPVIADSVFEGKDYFGKGIEIVSQAAPKILSNSISGFDIPVYLQSSYPEFSDNQLSDNNYNGVYIDCRSIFSKNTVWNNDLTYLLMSNYGDYPTIASGSILTIEPGTVLKSLNRYYTILKIKGGLAAQGIIGQPIIFTAFKDDSFGGDSNNDGDESAPEDDDWENPANLGEWKDIVFAAGSSGSLAHIQFKYGGYIAGFWPKYEPDTTLSIDPAAEVAFGEGVVVE